MTKKITLPRRGAVRMVPLFPEDPPEGWEGTMVGIKLLSREEIMDHFAERQIIEKARAKADADGDSEELKKALRRLLAEHDKFHLSCVASISGAPEFIDSDGNPVALTSAEEIIDALDLAGFGTELHSAAIRANSLKEIQKKTSD